MFFSIKAEIETFFTKTKLAILRLDLLKHLNNIHQENKVFLMPSSNLNITNFKLSSIFFLYCPLAQQKHNSKKVPPIRSKKGQRRVRGWSLVDNGRDQTFIYNLRNEN